MGAWPHWWLSQTTPSSAQTLPLGEVSTPRVGKDISASFPALSLVVSMAAVFHPAPNAI